MARLLKQTRFIAFLALAMLTTTAAFAPAQAQQSVRPKVVVQMSDGDQAKWNLALNNMRNMQAELGAANIDIELVVYGPGIGMVKADSVVGNRVDEAMTAGVKVLVCETTMTGAKLTPADMMSKVGYVRAGAVEITQKQMQGWAYLRP